LWLQAVMEQMRSFQSLRRLSVDDSSSVEAVDGSGRVLARSFSPANQPIREESREVVSVVPD